MKNILALLLLLLSGLASANEVIRIATYDSGFGGYFTAKEIELVARDLVQKHPVKFSIGHYGDTANAPYGEKTSEQIAKFTAKGIKQAFKDGAEEVFIACNTASTQYEAIKKLINAEMPGKGSKITSIIESSVAELKRQIDERFKEKKHVKVALLATPFTVKAMTYPKALAKAYGLSLNSTKQANYKIDRWYNKKSTHIENVTTVNVLKLSGGKTIEVRQMGPGNWVDMIEHAAPPEIQLQAVRSDLMLLPAKSSFDVIGEFCTHFPVFDEMVRKFTLERGVTTPETSYIKQGPLMAQIFKNMMTERISKKKRSIEDLDKAKLLEDTRPIIYLSGNNIEETKSLSRTVFPGDPEPTVMQKSFE